jgi:hypothetical protein
MPKPGDLITTGSLVSSETRRAAVWIRWGPMTGQFDPEDARAFAWTLLRTAANAEADAMFYSALRERTGVPESIALSALAQLRAHRAGLEQLAGLRRLPESDEIPEPDGR